MGCPRLRAWKRQQKKRGQGGEAIDSAGGCFSMVVSFRRKEKEQVEAMQLARRIKGKKYKSSKWEVRYDEREHRTERQRRTYEKKSSNTGSREGSSGGLGSVVGSRGHQKHLLDA